MVAVRYQTHTHACLFTCQHIGRSTLALRIPRYASTRIEPNG